MRSSLRQLDADLWVADAPLRFLGLELGARMTLVRLPGPRLLLHSPVAATPELVREVEALGPVASQPSTTSPLGRASPPSRAPPLTRIAFRLARAYGALSPSFVERLFVRDRRAFRRSLERILEWPIERVVVAHGAVSETGGREEPARGYAWVLGG